MAATTPTEAERVRAVYDSEDVARILGIARPTVYQIAREQPEKLGAIRIGRSVRFKRAVVDALVGLDG